MYGTPPNPDQTLHGRCSPDLLAYDFINQARARFPSVTSAVSSLKEIGSPPALPPDPSHPPSQVKTVLLIFASLGAYLKIYGPSAGVTIKVNWMELFGPWVRYLIEGFIMVGEKPSTIEGMDVLQYSMSFIPLLLYRRQALQRMEDNHELQQKDPHLQRLFTQVLLKALDESHPTWRVWLTQLFHLHGLSKPSSSHISSITNANFLRNTPYRNATPADIGLILVRHVNHIAHTARTTLLPHEVCDVKFFVSTLFNQDLSGHPILLTGVVRHAIPAFVNLISSFLHKRKSLKIVHQDGPGIPDTNNAECQDAYYVVDRVMKLLCIVLRGFEVDAMEAGIFDAIFKSFPCFYQVKRYSKAAWVGDLDQTFQCLLEGAAMMLVYPPVLRSFLRAVRRIEKRPELKEKMQKEWPAFWESWRLTKDKALRLWRIYRSAQQMRLSLCDYNQCPELQPDSHRPISYLRCAACLSVVYCSYSCRKKDWKTGHRVECSRLAELRSEGISPVSNHNTRFSRLCISSLLFDSAQEIGLQVEICRSNLSSKDDLSENGKLLRDGRKNPVLVLDFDAAKLEMPVPQVMDVDCLIKVNNPGALNVLEQWHDARAGKKNILVIALFPQNSRLEGGPRLLTLLHDFPIHEDDK
ncbi:hypothetical protein PM082_018424 [Marasmius tenuissimus]|nr:hypothetical protein PM082_018424 [Marasmius tenuissimus]